MQGKAGGAISGFTGYPSSGVPPLYIYAVQTHGNRSAWVVASRVGYGYRWFRLNGVLSFWFAYVVTRPLGASFADWVGVSHSRGGLGVGTGLVSLALAGAIALLVAHLTVESPGRPRRSRRQRRALTSA